MSKILLPPHKEIKVEGEVALSENGGQGGIEDVGKGGPMDKPLLSLPKSLDLHALGTPGLDLEASSNTPILSHSCDTLNSPDLSLMTTMGSRVYAVPWIQHVDELDSGLCTPIVSASDSETIIWVL